MASHLNLYASAGDDIVIIRHRHLTLCDGNYCAAMLLDQFYAQADSALEFGEHPDFYKTFQELVEDCFDMFPLQDVREALSLLLKKDYIETAYREDQEISQENKPIHIVCHYQKVNADSRPYREEKRIQQEIAWHAEQAEEEIRENIPTATKTTYSREAEKVKQHCHRARKLDLPATLTVDEWLETLEYFEWKCAYCRDGDYIILEHFIPLSMDGGTTQGNCVPACNSCNGVKQTYHPYQIPFAHTKQAKAFLQGVQLVHHYLLDHGCEEEAIS